MRWRRARGSRGNERTSTAPSASCGAPSGGGLRTARAHVRTPRIITPSSTAWPPMGASRKAVSGAPARASSDATRPAPSVIGRALRAGAGASRPTALGHPALEALDAAAGVDQLLLAGVEGVAGGADLDVDLGLGGASRELVAARAGDVGLDVLGMDFGLHRNTKSSRGRSVPRRPAGRRSRA